MQPTTEYVPGVCNIGDVEVRNRRSIGRGALVVTVALGVGLMVIDAPPAVFVLLALPGFVMATGFLQARSRFCTGYGMAGMSNFSDQRGAGVKTEAPAHRAADRGRAKVITTYSAIAGLLVGLVAAALAALA
jgi:hypothetical protein